jgi:DNA-binding HxlR family transcriptional regulator
MTDHQAFRSRCPINIAVEIIGDRWSLLIVRDLMFKGRHSFGALLEGGEGISTNILADRLQRLKAHGIIEQAKVQGDSRRIHYRLTRRGIDLAPMLVETMLWSSAYEKTDAPPAQLKAMRTNREAFIAEVVERWRAAQEV